MKRSGRFLTRHLWLVTLGAIVAAALSFPGPALSGPEGTLKWAFATGGKVGSSPAIGANGTIYVGSDDNNVYAINPDGSKKWEFLTGGWVRSSPALDAAGIIYIGSEDYKVYAISPQGRRCGNFLPVQECSPPLHWAVAPFM